MFSQLFSIAEAIVAAGESLFKLYNNEYPSEFLGFVLAWYRNHNLVTLHSRDANTKRKGSGDSPKKSTRLPKKRRPRR